MKDGTPGGITVTIKEKKFGDKKLGLKFHRDQMLLFSTGMACCPCNMMQH